MSTSGSAIADRIKKLPGVSALISTDSYKALRQRATLLLSDRRACTFTLFARVPTQFEALAGPVLELLGLDRELRIAIVGSSNGAEAYTISSALTNRTGGSVPFRIDAYDIDQKVIEEARAATYPLAAVHKNPMITDGFIASTFDREGDLYRVKRPIRERVRFGIADVFAPDLMSRIGKADVVFAQNLLYHFKPREAGRAFSNIVGLLADRAVLFVDGVDLDVRTKMTEAHRLQPLTYRIADIHEEAYRVRGSSYPYMYFGLEPFRPERRDWVRRYATIFTRSG